MQKRAEHGDLHDGDLLHECDAWKHEWSIPKERASNITIEQCCGQLRGFPSHTLDNRLKLMKSLESSLSQARHEIRRQGLCHPKMRQGLLEIASARNPRDLKQELVGVPLFLTTLL